MTLTLILYLGSQPAKPSKTLCWQAQHHQYAGLPGVNRDRFCGDLLDVVASVQVVNGSLAVDFETGRQDMLSQDLTQKATEATHVCSSMAMLTVPHQMSS